MANKAYAAFTCANDLKAALRGPRFGNQADSALNRLVARAQSVQRRIVGTPSTQDEATETSLQAEFEKEVREVSAVSQGLRLGGSCEHGGDKGPNCRHCGGRPVGRYVALEPGLDVVDYCIKRLVHDEKTQSALALECDRVEAALQSVDDMVKDLRRRLEDRAKHIKRLQKKRLTGERAKKEGTAETSIDKIKRQFVDVDALHRSHEVLEVNDVNVKQPIRVKVGPFVKINVLVSLADLNAEYPQHESAFIWFKTEIAAQVKHRCGRIISFKALSAIIDDEAISITDLNSLRGVLEERSDSLKRVTWELLEWSFHEPMLSLSDEYIVWTKENGSINERSRDHSSIRSLLRRLNPETLKRCIVLEHWPSRIPPELLFSICFRDIQTIDFAFCRLSFADLAAAITTMPHLKRLSVCGSKCSDIGRGLDMLIKNDGLIELEYLDLSGVDLYREKHFGKALATLPQLQELRLASCFSIPVGHTLDEDSEYTFVATLDYLRFPGTLRVVDLSSNAFVDLPSAKELLLRISSIPRLRELNLSHSRVYSVFEAENAIKSFAEAASVLRSTTLNVLRLSGTNLGNNGAQSLFTIIRENGLPQLRQLHVDNTCASTEVLESLRQFPSLTTYSNYSSGVRLNGEDCISGENTTVANEEVLIG